MFLSSKLFAFMVVQRINFKLTKSVTLKTQLYGIYWILTKNIVFVNFLQVLNNILYLYIFKSLHFRFFC